MAWASLSGYNLWVHPQLEDYYESAHSCFYKYNLFKTTLYAAYNELWCFGIRTALKEATFRENVHNTFTDGGIHRWATVTSWDKSGILPPSIQNGEGNISMGDSCSTLSSSSTHCERRSAVLGLIRVVQHINLYLCWNINITVIAL